MTTQPQGGVIPEWTRGERLAKARKLTGMSTRAFAAAIGVSQKTVNNAEGDESVKPITLKMWALTTGVNIEWLEFGTGEARPTPPGPGKPSDPDAAIDALADKKRSRARHTRASGATSRYAATAA